MIVLDACYPTFDLKHRCVRLCIKIITIIIVIGQPQHLFFNVMCLSFAVQVKTVPHFHVSNSLFACINTGWSPKRGNLAYVHETI